MSITAPLCTGEQTSNFWKTVMRKWAVALVCALLVCGGYLWTSLAKVRAAPVSLARRARPLVVQVVEEHHEVVPYWEREGRFSVLHVDAHEDTAAPSVVDRRTARSSMSSNDVFVLASLMRGRVDSFTWIWPAWDVLG